ncbi:MAG: AarF/ABC1/UbiB kinase family protein [Thermoplasmataceae archaeon]
MINRQQDQIPPKGIRRRELRALRTLYPVFRRYTKDRKSTRRQKENEWNYRRQRNGDRAVEAFIRLGPTFIKLGQVISARPDLLPKEYLASFERLQDDVPPAAFDSVRPIIERNIGKIEEVFDNFDREAISGASLGQVYRAVYKGREVAVKVNRPGVKESLRTDLIVIRRLLRVGRRFIDNFLYYSISNVIEDFSSRILDETNYLKEADNIRRIRENIHEREDVIIPSVIGEVSAAEVLVMSYEDGIKITEISKLKEKGIDLKKLAWNIDLLFMRMLLRDDIFHADPHPGNLSVKDDGTIVLYDFGMTGNLDKKTRFDLLSLYDGLVSEDPDSIIDALLSLNALSPAANRGIIRQTMSMIIAGMQGKNPNEMEIRELLEIANGVIFEFPFKLPRSLVLYMRMSSLLEGICMQLDPDFQFVRVMRQMLYNEGLLSELYSNQIENFAGKAIKAVEKGLEALPLLKRQLEDATVPPGHKDPYRRVSSSVFLGFVLIASALFYGKFPLYSELAIFLDIIAFLAMIIKK